MKKLTYRIQEICGYLAAVLVVLTGLNFALAFVLSLFASSDLSAKADEDFKDITPEQFFHRVDGSTTPVDQYDKLFDFLETKCLESRNELGLMVFSLNKKNREDGLQEAHLETLKAFAQESEVAFENKGLCIEVHSYLNPENSR